jgi:hypothetical protein
MGESDSGWRWSKAPASPSHDDGYCSLSGRPWSWLLALRCRHEQAPWPRTPCTYLDMYMCTYSKYTCRQRGHVSTTAALDRRQAKSGRCWPWDLACTAACREPPRPMDSPRLCVRSTTTCSVLTQPLYCCCCFCCSNPLRGRPDIEYTLQPPDARSLCVQFRREKEKSLSRPRQHALDLCLPRSAMAVWTQSWH